jgi:hypothetical protein
MHRRQRQDTRLRSAALVTLVLTLTIGQWATALEFPGPDPGAASGQFDEGQLVLENAVIAAVWRVADGEFRLVRLEDRIAHQTLHLKASEAFRVELADGSRLSASEFQIVEEPKLVRLEPERETSQASTHDAGWQAAVRLTSPDGRMDFYWHATLRDHSNYVRTELTLVPKQVPIDLASVVMIEVDHLQAEFGGIARGPIQNGPSRMQGAGGGKMWGARSGPGLVGPNARPLEKRRLYHEVAGTVSGSPVVAGNLFFACEHPLAENYVNDEHIECVARYRGSLERESTWSRSAVIGVTPPGQTRRAFLYYIERERARPYRLFLHYNSWWDIAWPGRQMDEAQCLEVMEQFGRELYEKRGVALDSFVFDDGWDDPKTLWQFHDGFPRGFKPHQVAAEKQDSAIGVWLSPWGGYGQAKADRIAYGKTQGFETNSRGFSLAGPTYYARYADACKKMIAEYGANYFKFDGIGQGLGEPGAENEFAADVEALLDLTRELRNERPDVYLSITTGTWPSPYWLWYGDSVWRNGHDLGFHGAGSMRQQSITYRDMFVRRMIVDRAPLYPFNSLMTVTLCQAQLGTAAKMVNDVDDLGDEIRMAFASGTQLLELYVTPSRMTDEGWDVLAECTRWSRENADALVDVHWVGGDPGEAKVYGYAGWSPRKGILTLRNPSAKPQSISLKLADAFELPNRLVALRLTTPWSAGDRGVPEQVVAREAFEFELEPMEILLIEAAPAK